MSPTAWGALKYAAKMLGLRKPYDAVDPQFMRPQGFHDPNDVDLKKLRLLIKHGKLAPCYPGREMADDETAANPLDADADAAKGGDRTPSGDVHLCVISANFSKATRPTSEAARNEKDDRANPSSFATDKPERLPPALDECPICFLCYPCLNKSRCCSSEICTECYLRVLAPSNAPEEYDHAGRRLMRPPRCPFCKTEGYGVAFAGAKSAADRAAEAEERVALAKALEAARAAELAEQAERRARRASVEAARASLSAPYDPSSAETAARRPPEPPSPLPSSPAPVGWEAEYAAMTPPDPAVDPTPSSVFPRDNDRARPSVTLNGDDDAWRRVARPRDRNESRAFRESSAALSSRRSERRAFLPAGPAFLPRRPRNPELFTADHGYRGSRDERRALRELARRGEERNERRRRAAERDATRGVDDSDGLDEAFLAHVRDFVPARLLEASFGDLGAGDVDGEAALDIAASGALDIDDAMMMEAVYLSLQERERANRHHAAPGGRLAAELAPDAMADAGADARTAEAAEAAEVEEAIALVAAAEAAEAAGRSVGDVASSGDLARGREAPVSIVQEADATVDEADTNDDETDTRESDAFDAVDESLAALEAEASRNTAHRLVSLSRQPAPGRVAGAPRAAAADADAEKSSPHAPVPDADDITHIATQSDASAFEAAPEAEAARAIANAAGAPRAGEKSAPEKSETALQPAARSAETLPSALAPGAALGGGAGTGAVLDMADSRHTNAADAEHAPKLAPPDLPDVPSTRDASPRKARPPARHARRVETRIVDRYPVP